MVAIDLAGVVAGTKYRGEFEERLRQIIEELKNAKVIAFIDELHTLIGAGGAEGTLDAANILKPALARGEIQVIGATTTGEYHRYIEKDAALERRFQPVIVLELLPRGNPGDPQGPPPPLRGPPRGDHPRRDPGACGEDRDPLASRAQLPRQGH